MTTAKPTPPEPEWTPATEAQTGDGSEPVYRAEPGQSQADVANQNVAAALEDMAAANPGLVTPDPEETPDPDPPVYDERGNVRPRGTPGATPMTKAERVKIAARLRDGEQIVTTAEKKPKSKTA